MISLQTGLPLAAAKADGGGAGGAMMQLLLLFGAMYMIFWVLVIRPQRKQQRQRREMLSDLKKNDRVLTSGGIFGTITQVREGDVTLKIDDNVRVRLAKSAVTEVIRPERADAQKGKERKR